MMSRRQSKKMEKFKRLTSLAYIEWLKELADREWERHLADKQG